MIGRSATRKLTVAHLQEAKVSLNAVDELVAARKRWAVETGAAVTASIREGLTAAAPAYRNEQAFILMMAGYRMALRQLRTGTITRGRAACMSVAEATELEEAIAKAMG
jgi:hypothetical protein